MEGDSLRAIPAAEGTGHKGARGAAGLDARAQQPGGTEMNGPWRLSSSFERWLYAMAVAGFLTLATGLFLSPQRALGSLLMAGFGLVCVGLAGIFFVAILYASGAAWGTACRRAPEAMSAILPYGAAVLAVVFIFGSSLYPWIHDRGEITEIGRASCRERV